jgi:1,4-alpha-glucan branching enzyme
MPKFVSAGTIDGKDWGAEGWMKVTVDVPFPVEDGPTGNVLGAKPVQLTKDGGFFWDYQVGYQDHNASLVEVKAGGVEVDNGYTNECNIYFTSNATAEIIFKAWKNDPCKEAPKHNVTFSVTVPEGTPDDAVVRIVGSFATSGYPNWEADGEGMELKKGADGKYSITLSLGAGGVEYKYVVNGSWDNGESQADPDGLGCVPERSNRSITVSSSTTINDVVENWKGITTCVPSGLYNYTFVVTVPEGTPDDAEVNIAGGMNDWNPSASKLTKGADGTYSITFEDLADGVEYKYVLNGSWDNEELAAAEDGADCAPGIAGNRKTGAEETIEDTVENWKGVTIDRCE